MILTKSEIRELIIECLLLESKLSKFKDLLALGKINQEDLDKMWHPTQNRWRSPFNSDLYRAIVYNSLMADENHSINDYKVGFPLIKTNVLEPYKQTNGRIPEIFNPDAGEENVLNFDINEILANKTATYNQLEMFVNAKKESKRDTGVLQRIIDRAISEEPNEDLELIHTDSNWVIMYPKSYKGSIAVSKMGGDLKYYGNATQQNSSIGRIPWCIAPDTTGNMFLNYHRRLNLHMYIATRVGDGYRNGDANKKICISFSKNHGFVRLVEKAGSTVDSNNRNLSEKSVKKLITKAVYEKLVNDAELPSRKEMDEISYYKSINLEQFKNIENAIDENSEQDFARWLQEVSKIVKNTDELLVLKYIYENYQDQRLIMNAFNESRHFNKNFILNAQQSGVNIVPLHRLLIDEKYLFKVTKTILSIEFKELISNQNRLDMLKMMAVTSPLAFPEDIQISIANFCKETLSSVSKRRYAYQGEKGQTSIVKKILMHDETWSISNVYEPSLEAIQSMLDKEHFERYLDDYPYISNFIYSDIETYFNAYRARAKSYKAEQREARKKGKRANKNPRVFQFGLVPSNERMIELLDLRNDLDHDFILSALLPYLGATEHNPISFGIDPEIVTKSLEFYKILSKRNKKSFLRNCYGYESSMIQKEKVAELYYELYHKNPDSEFLEKCANTRLGGYILGLAINDGNYDLVSIVFEGKSGPTLLAYSDSESFGAFLDALKNSEDPNSLRVAGSYSKIVHESNQGELPDWLIARCIQKIKEDNNYDITILYSLSPTQDLLESEVWNSTVNQIFNSNNQDAKEELLTILSSSPLMKDKSASDLDVVAKNKVTDTIVNNLDVFYNESRKAAETTRNIIDKIPDEKILFLLYKMDGDQTIDDAIRMGAAYGLIDIVKKFFLQVSSIIRYLNDEYHPKSEEDFIEGTTITNGIKYISYKSLVEKTFSLIKPEDNHGSYIENAIKNKYDWTEYSTLAAQMIKKASKLLETEDFFDRQAYAIDMNKNKRLFETFFNLREEINIDAESESLNDNNRLHEILKDYFNSI